MGALRITAIVSGVAAVYFILGAAGTSDFETIVDDTVVHSTWWIIKMILVGCSFGVLSYISNYFYKLVRMMRVKK
jgi:hypothetical protein